MYARDFPMCEVEIHWAEDDNGAWVSMKIAGKDVRFFTYKHDFPVDIPADGMERAMKLIEKAEVCELPGGRKLWIRQH